MEGEGKGRDMTVFPNIELLEGGLVCSARTATNQQPVWGFLGRRLAEGIAVNPNLTWACSSSPRRVPSWQCEGIVFNSNPCPRREQGQAMGIVEASLPSLPPLSVCWWELAPKERQADNPRAVGSGKEGWRAGGCAKLQLTQGGVAFPTCVLRQWKTPSSWCVPAQTHPTWWDRDPSLTWPWRNIDQWRRRKKTTWKKEEDMNSFKKQDIENSRTDRDRHWTGRQRTWQVENLIGPR